MGVAKKMTAIKDFYSHIVALKPNEYLLDSKRSDKKKEDLIDLLLKFKKYGLSINPYEEEMKITEKVFILAKSIIENFPDKYSFPKLITDEENSLLMSWRGKKIILITINDGYSLDIIIDARSENPIIYENIQCFPSQIINDYTYWPEELKEALEHITDNNYKC